MKIGIDISLLLYPEVAGMRVYLERLLSGLLRMAPDEEFLLFYHTRRSWSRSAHEVLDRLKAPNARLVAAPGMIRAIPDSAWWWGYYPPLEHLVQEPVDVFHVGEFLFPRSSTTPLVGTLYDLTPELFPDLHLWPNRVRHARQMKWLAKHADRAIAISQATAIDFRGRYATTIPIDVIHPGPGLASVPDAANLLDQLRQQHGISSAPYILCVGTIEPRKNADRLIHAFEQAVDGGSGILGEVHLVFAGANGWKSQTVYSAAANSSVADRIHFTGRVDSDALAALYSGAAIFAYPSLYEGFGLPVLEAMAAGVPVLTSNTSSLPEVAGDAALLVDPTSVAAIRSGLARLLKDERLRSRLGKRGKEQQRQFTWKRTAELTLESYLKAIADRPSRVV